MKRRNNAYVATNSVYQAAVTFTSRHYGAKKYKRIGTVMRCCCFVTALTHFTVSMVVRRRCMRMYPEAEDTL